MSSLKAPVAKPVLDSRRSSTAEPITIATAIALLLPACAHGGSPATASPAPQADSPFNFSREYIDTNYGGNGKPGWVRAGDMDLDGDLPFGPEGFQQRLEAGKGDVIGRANDLESTLFNVLGTLGDIRRKLASVEAGRYADTRSDIEQQLARLLFNRSDS